jgi:hypothetical protein
MRDEGKPIIWQMGAHPIKGHMSLLLIDIIKRGFVSLFAGNGAVAIHDFEWALIGETSETVPNALPQGQFGMAYETGTHMNDCMVHGNHLELGLGESLARMILGEEMPYGVEFKHPEASVIAQAYEMGVPATIHVGVGTDIIDQHPTFDGRAKGGCSGRDFGIYTAVVAGMTDGGMIINIGSAVTGPEVFLKAVSMTCNVGKVADKITTADFDIRPAVPEDMTNEDKPSYYQRDVKSIVTRVPQAFGGKGYYVEGNFLRGLPRLYQLLVEKTDEE